MITAALRAAASAIGRVCIVTSSSACCPAVDLPTFGGLCRLTGC